MMVVYIYDSFYDLTLQSLYHLLLFGSLQVSPSKTTLNIFVYLLVLKICIPIELHHLYFSQLLPLSHLNSIYTQIMCSYIPLPLTKNIVAFSKSYHITLPHSTPFVLKNLNLLYVMLLLQFLLPFTSSPFLFSFYVIIAIPIINNYGIWSLYFLL